MPPMQTQYFIMHIVPLVILTILAGAGMVIFGIVYVNDTQSYTVRGPERKKFKWIFLSFLCLLLFSGNVIWWVGSANQPWRHEYTSLHEVKDVIFPDGSKVQMFTCDGVHHNVTSMFGKFVDESEWQIRRVRWSPIYLWVSWSGCLDRCTGDHYFLEHKKGDLPSVEILERNAPMNSVPIQLPADEFQKQQTN